MGKGGNHEFFLNLFLPGPAPIDTPPKKSYTSLAKEVNPVKKYDFLKIINTYVIPSLVIALGVILILNPDSASALVSSLMGWVLVAVVCATGATGLGLAGPARTTKLLWAAAALLTGIWLLCQPLMLVSALGRILALGLLYWGGSRLWDVYRIRRSGGYAPWPVIAAVTAGLGLVLLVSPLSASRLLFRVVGIVVAALGISELIRRVSTKGCLEEGDDPNIIDAL